MTVSDHDQPYAPDPEFGAHLAGWYGGTTEQATQAIRSALAGYGILPPVQPTSITLRFPLDEGARRDVAELLELDRLRSWLRFNQRRHGNPFPRIRLIGRTR